MQNPNAWRLDQEYLAIVDDLLQHEEVQQLAQYTQHHFSNRLRHSISVSYQSYVIAKKIGADATATARAGLLHDLFYYDWRVTKFEAGSHAYVHPRIALQNAKKLTAISDKKRISLLNTCLVPLLRYQSTAKAGLFQSSMISQRSTNIWYPRLT